MGSMFKNYLIIAWRNIKRNKAYSALNVLGLAVGMAVFILIMLFVRTETSYDRYHENARNIYRVVQEQPGNVYLGSNVFAVTSPPMAAAMVQDFPEVLKATRINDSSNILIKVGDKTFLEKKFHWSDPQTFEIFSFPLVRGDRASALKEPFSVLLSERAARRLFGDADPLDRTISLRGLPKTADLKVTGIFRDLPANSHFDMDIVAPFETMPKVLAVDLSRWGNNSYYTYILLKDGADPRTLEAKLVPFIVKYEAETGWKHDGQRSRYFLQPLTRIHLHSRANFELAAVGDSRFVFLFASIAVLVLIIACINFMNLSTARSAHRAREIGLRKVVGARRPESTTTGTVGTGKGATLAWTPW
jgi:putative ABC transport system permease protein